MAIVPAFVLLSIVGFVFYYSIPAIKFMGINFFTTFLWNPGIQSKPPEVVNGVLAPFGASFGILLFLLGTVVTSLLALLIAFPLSFLLALTIELYTPLRLKRGLISLVELFAGIPSVVYGLWGIVVLEPVLLNSVEPWMSANLSFIPGFSGEVYTGAGIIASGIILSIMIAPIITSVMVNSFDTAPEGIKRGIISLGATKWELGKYLITNYSRSSTYGGTLLGLGRALGETMAVLMVSGGLVNVYPGSIYSAINTMAAHIASYLDSAFFDSTGMNVAALAYLGLVLMGISLVVNIIGRKIAGRGVLRGYESD
ncbi:hypothetical protein IX51_05030 [uncultured archaeon]|nr:hypothetical protein IX51_05030 [uncultured archaeon]